MGYSDSGPVAEPGRTYDVAILGSHLASGVLAAILARHGADVVLLDAPGDRAEPSGESTVPYTTAVIQLLAERFDLPEVGALAHLTDVPDWVQQVSGVKRSLAFLHHTAGRRHDPAHAVQFHVPGEHTEWHPYRPAVDLLARQIAVGRGVHTVPDRTAVSAVRLTGDGAAIELADGNRFAARYVVDACGTDSPLLTSLGLVETGARGRLRSRVMTTHMVGVRPFEECARLSDYKGATPWSTGTLHHLFDGGWIQVVDFGNHEHSSNTLASVTVGLDPGRFNLPDDPEDAFRALIARYPSIREQFAQAVASRPWVGGNPWQRSVSVTYGPNWFAMERSACRTDELLSRDVTVAMEVVHALAVALLRVLDGAAAEPELARVAAFQDTLIDFNDQMLAAARTATRDFRLFNAYTRVWLLWQILAHLSLKRATVDAANSPDGDWAAVQRWTGGGLWFQTPAGLAELLEWFFDQFAQVRAGELSPGPAAQAIFKALRRARFVPPLYRFGDPGSRYYHFTMGRRLLMLAWVKTVAPADFRRLLSKENVTGRRSVPDRAPVAATKATG